MKRLNFVFGEMCCLDMKITDSVGTKYFHIEPEKETSKIEIDISGESFDLTLTPLIPAEPLHEKGKIKLKDRIERKLHHSLGSFAINMYLLAECTYHVEKFHDGDAINLNSMVYSCPSNDLGDNAFYWDVIIFPVQYMFYDVCLNQKRIEPQNISCLNRKKVIRKARPFMLVGSDSFWTIVTYPVLITRIRFLSSKRKISSTLTKFSKMSEGERLKYINTKDFTDQLLNFFYWSI